MRFQRADDGDRSSDRHLIEQPGNLRVIQEDAPERLIRNALGDAMDLDQSRHGLASWNQPRLLRLFKAPPVVELVPVGDHDGRFWYSNRADQSDLKLTRAFDLTRVDSAELSFDLWYWLEEAWDYSYVMVSSDDGATWDILPTAHTTTYNPHDNAYGPGYNGQSGGWGGQTGFRDDYGGRQNLVRVVVVTDDGDKLPGRAVDNVRVDAVGYASDFEADDGGWQAEGWVWTDNRLPQRAWLQVAERAQNGEILRTGRWHYAPDLGETQSSWTLTFAPDARTVLLALSPYAPVTTTAMPYALELRDGACS